jgi:hypothetical protein
MVKELYHSSAEEHRSHLLSVVGIAGIGKSRLSWEVFKYLDGLAGTVFWHRGRCLAYGQGVAYWALAEMVRMRAGIAEGEADEGASAKLHAAVELYVPDPEERGWIEPRLAYLLGLEQSVARQREDLFGAWRLFFERLAEQEPVVLVFEDLQWADAALLDFIDYLLEWSRTHRLFVMTLARPEFADRRSDWGAGRRSFTSLYLDPLDESAMRSLLDALIPGLPEELADRILERAAGVPLYAVETIRMLLDRGLLQPEGTAYGLTGPVDALDIPETLHALIAARLDGLSPDEGRVVRDAAVLGKTKPASRSAPARWLGERAMGTRLSLTTSGPWRCTTRPAGRTRAREFRARWSRPSGSADRWTGQSNGWKPPSRSSPATSPTRIWPCSWRSSLGSITSRAISSLPESGWTSLFASPRTASSRRCSLRRSTRRTSCS